MVDTTLNRAGYAVRWMAAAVCCFPLWAGAGVNPQTGGFYITYRDAHVPAADGLALNVERTYNSFASHTQGWFGNGWGTLFETRLWVLPEGVAVVHENGSGSMSFYRPATAVAATHLDVAVERLVTESLRQKENYTADELRTRLRSSEEERYRATQRLQLQTPVAPGTLLRSELCAEAQLVRNPQGFERRNCNRTTDQFDAAGRLLVRVHPAGGTLKAHYAAGKHRPDLLSHSSGPRIALSWNAQGLATQVTLGAKTHHYTYSAEGSLIKMNESVSGVSDIWYGYEYDPRHNLTAVRYLDDTSLLLRYDDEERVVQETSRVGETTRYRYEVRVQEGTSPADVGTVRTTRITRISHTDAEGKTSEREVAFQSEVNDTGIGRTTAVGQSVDGRQSRTHRMDERGRVVVRTEPDGSRTELVYHPRTDKLIIALRGGDATAFHYHPDGTLARAQDGTGRTVELAYDAQGNISQLTEHPAGQPQRSFRLHYNSGGQLNVIDQKGVGRVEVGYNAQGEIDKVTSQGGPLVAAGVAQVFFRLLTMVRMAQ